MINEEDISAAEDAVCEVIRRRKEFAEVLNTRLFEKYVPMTDDELWRVYGASMGLSHANRCRAVETATLARLAEADKEEEK